MKPVTSIRPEPSPLDVRAVRAMLVHAHIPKGGRMYKRLAAFHLLPVTDLETAVMDLLRAGYLGLKRTKRGLYLVRSQAYEQLQERVELEAA